MIITLNSPSDAVRYIARLLQTQPSVVRHMWGYADPIDYIGLLADMVFMPPAQIFDLRFQAQDQIAKYATDIIEHASECMDVSLN